MTTTSRWFAAGVLVAAASTLHLVADGQQQPAQEQQNTQRSATAESAEPAMQCPMMSGLSGMKLEADHPAVLQAQAETLGLDEQQLAKLQEIQSTARRQASELLTAEQRRKLQDAPQGPLSMMQLSRLISQSGKPQQEANGQQKEGKKMCPMCQRMMQKRQQQDAGHEHEADQREPAGAPDAD